MLFPEFTLSMPQKPSSKALDKRESLKYPQTHGKISTALCGRITPLGSIKRLCHLTHSGIGLRRMPLVNFMSVTSAWIVICAEKLHPRILHAMMRVDIRTLRSSQRHQRRRRTAERRWPVVAQIRFMTMVIHLIGMRKMPLDMSPGPIAVGACRSVVAVHVASRQWLRSVRYATFAL